MYTPKTGLAALGFALMLSTTLSWPASANRAATHDFNGDGYSDLAWLDPTGDLRIWLLQGGSVMNYSNTIATTQGVGWQMVAQDNFFGGPSKILWQNTSVRLIVE